MRLHKMKNRAALQAYFNKRLLPIVAKHGKTMVGWDEILENDLPKDVVIQSWRGKKSFARAVELGHRAILSKGYYLDLMDPASAYYLNDPLDGPVSEVAPEARSLILGGEACMWAKYVNADTLDSRLWPRTAAIAERLWSAAEVKDVPSMYARLERVSEELTLLGLTQESG